MLNRALAFILAFCISVGASGADEDVALAPPRGAGGISCDDLLQKTKDGQLEAYLVGQTQGFDDMLALLAQYQLLVNYQSVEALLQTLYQFGGGKPPKDIFKYNVIMMKRVLDLTPEQWRDFTHSYLDRTVVAFSDEKRSHIARVGVIAPAMARLVQEIKKSPNEDDYIEIVKYAAKSLIAELARGRSFVNADAVGGARSWTSILTAVTSSGFLAASIPMYNLANHFVEPGQPFSVALGLAAGIGGAAATFRLPHLALQLTSRSLREKHKELTACALSGECQEISNLRFKRNWHWFTLDDLLGAHSEQLYDLPTAPLAYLGSMEVFEIEKYMADIEADVAGFDVKTPLAEEIRSSARGVLSDAPSFENTARLLRALQVQYKLISTDFITIENSMAMVGHRASSEVEKLNKFAEKLYEFPRGSMTENAIANGQVALAAIRQHLETLAKKQDELAHLKSSVAFVKANLDKFKGIAAPPVHVDDVLEIQEKARAALWIIDELERLQTENVMASRAGGL